ncbi:unnamed protein product [Enterobius vermicularis]|uniref:NPA domain-containing protein n=1 Tax=Enterobius vermicularis TaxID=51028 RepID=A0A0N4VMH9_ENTVE|nr:unnamed protein product [Enterobius vermicularis]
MATVTDEELKEQFKAYAPVCKKLFDAEGAHRVRRHATINTLEHHLDHSLKWLTDAQKEELKLMEADGKAGVEIRDQVRVFYKELSEEKKPEVRELLREGCRDMLRDFLGLENTKKLSEMKFAGKTIEEIEEEAHKLISDVTDKDRLGNFSRYAPDCMELFAMD